MRKHFLIGVILASSVLLFKSEPIQAQEPPIPKPDQKYLVASGDSLSMIAENHALESWVPLWNANPAIEHPDVIHPGQELIVPGGETAERPLPQTAVVQPLPQTQAVKPVASRRVAQSPVYHNGTGGVLARIRQLESGGNYAINTGNGYYGAYQFDLSTWRGVGGSGLPSQASPEEQDMRAQMLYSRRGCNPWPNTCR
jgi:LysM repeat protein